MGAGLVLAAAGGTSIGYALAIEPDWLVVEKVTVPLTDLPPALDGLRVVQLSDLHWGPYTGHKEISAAVDQANRLSGDLIVLTGDYVLSSAAYAAPCAVELGKLRAPLGVYAIPGNHDYWTDIDIVMGHLTASRLTILRNRSQRLMVGDTALWLTGIDDVMERHHDPEAALEAVPVDDPVLLLVHEPDFADEVARLPHRILLQLSGHSHGGQVNLPIVGPPVLPWLGTKYPSGLQTVRDSTLLVYTNRGVGLIAPPLRFNCRPEVAQLTLVRRT